MELGIDGLEWQAVIGHGGFGTVHRAHDDDHGRDVAVKLLHAVADEDGRRRFDRERRLMGTLSAHPNIVTVHTSGITASGVPYLVMEYVTGGSLADRIAAGPMEWPRVVAIGVALADALALAHDGGIAHRDIKPENILISADGRPMLTDFGIAVAASDVSLRDTISATPAYAPPELLGGQEADARSDIYSLGATLYACLVGHRPYGGDGEAVLTVLTRIANDPVPVIDDPEVPDALRALVADTMAKGPAERPADMRELARRLEAVGDGAEASPVAAVTPAAGVPVSPPEPAPAPDRSLAIGLGLLGTAVVVVVVAVVLLMSGGDDGGGAGPASSVAVTSTAPATSEASTTAAPATTVAAPAVPAIAVPAVDGRSIGDARAALEDVGLVVSNRPACSNGVARGTEPPAGTELDGGAAVELVVDPCIVPGFVGLTLDEAVAAVEEIDGLGVSWPDHCDDVVLGQTPEPGTVVERGTEIALDLMPC
jgi:Protein kinase domain/PASTA domain